MEKPDSTKEIVEEYSMPGGIVIDESVYKLGLKVGEGGFGKVYRYHILTRAKDFDMPEDIAIKVEPITKKNKYYHPKEWDVYEALQGTKGVPKVYYKGRLDDQFIMITDLLGDTLEEAWRTKTYDLPEVPAKRWLAKVAIETIAILQRIHERNFVHGDIKAENIMFGKEDSKLFLIDFGLGRRWRHSDGKTVSYHQNPDDFHGTTRFASVHAHLGRRQSRRDDLESLAYTFIFLLKGRLPWQGLQGDNKDFLVCKKKMETSSDVLCGLRSCPFKDFFYSVIDLEYEEEPPYETLARIFSHYISRSSQETKFSKRISRSGCSVNQWITVTTEARCKLKQGYYLNVHFDDVEKVFTSVQKHDLVISQVVWYMGRWNFVCDGAYRKTPCQIYMLSQHGLPQDWVKQRWDKGYYIKAISWDNKNRIFVVMDNSLPYEMQTIKIIEGFPYEWIKGRWQEGFHVTHMSSSPDGIYWCVVMSTNTGISEQAVEIDFIYPRDGIRQRWNMGYLITCAAANFQQCCFVLSKCKEEQDRAQETTRSNSFPENMLEENLWPNKFFISCICYGRTTC